MARISITELDNSAYLNRNLANDNIVLVGGTWGKDATNNEGKSQKFILCRSLREFYSNFGSTPPQTDNIGWLYAEGILRAGFPVLYYVYGASSANDEQKLNDIFSNNNLIALSDKNRYQIKFIPTIYTNIIEEGGEEDDDPVIDATIIKNIISLVDPGNKVTSQTWEARGDALIFLDITKDTVTEAPSDAKLGGYAPRVRNMYLGEKRDEGGSITTQGIKSSYVASAYPWKRYFSQNSPKDGILMPPSFWVLKTMAEGYMSGLPIYSTWAGAKRAEITGEGAFSKEISLQTMHYWTEQESMIPLMNIYSYGNLIYGNSTCNRYSDYNGTGEIKKSALDSLNVRITANEIKRAIFNICLGLTFDTNDIVLWTEFKERLIPLLDSMKANRALNDYLIIMDTMVTNEDIDDLRVPGIVKVDIARAAENFDITFELTPTGAIFDNI